MNPARQMRSARASSSAATSSASRRLREAPGPAPITFEEIPLCRAFARPAADSTSETTRTMRAGISPRSHASARASKFDPRPDSRTASRAGSGQRGRGRRTETLTTQANRTVRAPF